MESVCDLHRAITIRATVRLALSEPTFIGGVQGFVDRATRRNERAEVMRWIMGVFAACLIFVSATICGTGCSEKTSANSPAAVADKAPVENDAEPGTVDIDDDFEIVPSSRASSSG
jgi:hypothetical protein